jgi:hypothetical protein
MNQTHVIDPDALGNEPITVELCDSCKDNFYRAMRKATISHANTVTLRMFPYVLIGLVVGFFAGFLFHAFLPVVSR